MTGPVIRIEDEADFLALLSTLAEIGATQDGGVCRLAGSTADGMARRLLADRMANLGADIAVDAVGNQFGRLQFGEGLGSILCGSHLDSQPTGGRFDGSLGVAAAVIAGQILKRTGRHYRYDLVICNWTNEEGARFTPSLTGSSVFAGSLAANAALGLRDQTGKSLGDALAGIGFLGTAQSPRDAVAAIELHIEQGPHLEANGRSIGIVTGNWAARKLRLWFRGEPAHTGPTALAQRQDALLAAARFICLAHDLSGTNANSPILSIARASIEPNSANVIASDVRLWVEIRHPDPSVCQTFGQALLGVAANSSQLGGCSVLVEDDALRLPSDLSSTGAELARQVCDALHLTWRDMKSVAGHDALALASILPATLLFVPSRNGISHSPKEFTSNRDLIGGLHVFVHWLHRRLMG